MCRSTVGRVVAIDGSDAIVRFDGIERRASALLVPDLEPGDLVLIGLGTVLGRVTESDLRALEALEADIAEPTRPDAAPPRPDARSPEAVPPRPAVGRPEGARP